ncbi:MAG: BON domain-containing protein, partial [Cocleimonas sp.]|nr:BON domain-containing protein [Cocleimonas sp.]
MANGRSCCCAGLAKGWWWLLTLLGLPFLYYLMLSAKWEPIEKNIQSRTTEQLNDNGLGWSNVEIERRGRDVLLTGTATTDAKRDDAIKIAQGVEGVRTVDSDITIVPLKKRALLANYDHKEGKLVIEGVLSSQDKVDELLKILADSIGADNIINQLTVSDQYAREGGTLVLSGLALSDDVVSHIASVVTAGSSTLGLELTNNLAIDKVALKAITEKAEADKLAVEKVEAAKLAAEKAEADKLAAE